MSTARLRGADHPELFEVASTSEGSAAIALSRGGAPKRYRYLDPNEDAAGFAISEWGSVAVIADAHAGHQAAQISVDRLLDTHAPRWLAAAPIALDARFANEAVEVAFDTNTAIVQAAIGGESDGSRTTLSAVLLRPGDGWMAVLSVGDSHVFRCDAAGTFEVAAQKSEQATYLGEPGHTPERLEPGVRAEVMPIEDARAIVLATDGLSEQGIGVANPALAVEEAVARAGLAEQALRALSAARGVVELALESHREKRSGDNIASAVLWLE